MDIKKPSIQQVDHMVSFIEGSPFTSSYFDVDDVDYVWDVVGSITWSQYKYLIRLISLGDKERMIDVLSTIGLKKRSI